MKHSTTLLMLGLMLISQACKKSEDAPAADTTPIDTAGAENVFICGFLENNGDLAAALWNKRNNKLLGIGDARAVAVTDNDVAVAINYNVNGMLNLSVWENGSTSEITPPNSNTDMRAIDIEYSSGSLYIAVQEYNNNILKACVYKDNQRTELPDSGNGANVTALFIDGSDVYVSGSIRSPLNYREYACIWKNGTLDILSNGKFNTQAHDVFVSGGNIYATGYSTYNAFYTPYVWKNGVEDSLLRTSTYCQAISMSVVGNDEYILGFDNNELIVWKNRVPTAVPNSKELNGDVYPRKIIVKNGKTYILSIHDNNSIAYNYLWIDGVRQLIAQGVYSIAWGMGVR